MNSLASTAGGGAKARTGPVAVKKTKAADRANEKQRPKSKRKTGPVAKDRPSTPAASDRNSKAKTAIAGWIEGIPLVRDFGDPGIDLFVAEKVPKGLFEVKKGKLFVGNIPAARKWTSLPINGQSLKPGYGISVKTNFPVGRQVNHRLGFSGGGASAVLSVVRDGGKPTLALTSGKRRVTTLDKVGGSELLFAVYRPEKDDVKLRWFIVIDNRLVSGEVPSAEQSTSDRIALIYTAPKKPYPSPLWIDDLRIGSVKVPPSINLK